MFDHLVTPHGGKLFTLLADPDRAAELKLASRGWPSWEFAPRQLCDLELLLNGGFSPLEGFLTRADYESTCASMRLANGILWPIPVTLDIPEALARTIAPGTELALRDPEGVLLAALHVEEVWKPDRLAEAQAVYGTTNPEHPGVGHLLNETNPWYVGGRIEGIALPTHYDFIPLRLTPVELRAEFQRLGWRRTVAFQTRNPLHRAHQEATLRAALEAEAHLLLHPVVGMTKAGDVDHYTRVRCYQAILNRYPPHTVKLALLPLAMRMAGPREALWHAIIRKNYGCSHFIVGGDHAGPGNDSSGRPFYDPHAAYKLLRRYEEEIGVKMIPGTRPLAMSETELRRRLALGRELPSWFTFPEVAQELQRRYPPRHRQGFCVFFTGLSGSGKSTLARILQVKLLEHGGRSVTLLDGDLVRKHLSSELGFSKEHRDINIRRIGFVASEIVKNGGIALCAPIAPYDRVRKEVRALIEPWGGFVLVYLSTPLHVCEERDRKGLYVKARAGLIPSFTGISDPYESPADADVVIDTGNMNPEESAQKVMLHLEREGYITAAAGQV